MQKPLVPTLQYMRELFEDSLLTGIPQIVQTRSISRKIIKSLVFIGCLFGFIYQTSQFLNIFWSYPTVLDIDVKYPEEIESPALTFCNLNGIKRNIYCKQFPEACSYPSNMTAFCDAFPIICKRQKSEILKFPEYDALRFEHEATFEELKSFGHVSHDILKHCRQLRYDGADYVDCGWEEMIHVAMSDGNSGNKNCYSLFSNVNSTVLNKHRLPVPKQREPLFHMAFDLEPDEYFRPDRQVGVMFSIHSPNIIINPFYNGFVIQPGRLYTVHLKVVEEKLLPSPYETQCKDYQAVWEIRGNRGPLSQEMCLDECVLNISKSQFNCVPPGIIYPNDERTCEPDELDFLEINMTECYSLCPQPCDFTDFEYDVQERKLEDESAKSIEDFYEHQKLIQQRAVVLVFLKRPEIVVYSHRPQYEDIEVFSFLGGYVGMWLGISLVAVFDFFESLVLIFNHWIRRRIGK